MPWFDIGLSGFSGYLKLTLSWRCIFIGLFETHPTGHTWVHFLWPRQWVSQLAICHVFLHLRHVGAQCLYPWVGHVALLCSPLGQNLKCFQAGSFLLGQHLVHAKQLHILASSPMFVVIIYFQQSFLSWLPSVTLANFSLVDFFCVIQLPVHWVPKFQGRYTKLFPPDLRWGESSLLPSPPGSGKEMPQRSNTFLQRHFPYGLCNLKFFIPSVGLGSQNQLKLPLFCKSKCIVLMCRSSVTLHSGNGLSVISVLWSIPEIKIEMVYI